MTHTVKRLNTGVYELSYKGRTFEIEDIKRASDGDCLPGWMAYEIITNKAGDPRRQYLNDYATKRDAIARTIAAVDAGF